MITGTSAPWQRFRDVKYIGDTGTRTHDLRKNRYLTTSSLSETLQADFLGIPRSGLFRAAGKTSPATTRPSPSPRVPENATRLFWPMLSKYLTIITESIQSRIQLRCKCQQHTVLNTHIKNLTSNKPGH